MPDRGPLSHRRLLETRIIRPFVTPYRGGDRVSGSDDINGNFVQSVRGHAVRGSGYANRGGDIVKSVEYRRANAGYASRVFLDIESVSPCQNLGQLGIEGVDIGDRVRR